MKLSQAVLQLSAARCVDDILSVVSGVARDLGGADGATVVFREGDMCHYAGENAIAPLWKGQRFPADGCISGWVMAHGRAAVIDDVFADERIPAESYRPTFVRSMAMVPVRAEDPLGAIGVYWARPHGAGTVDLDTLQALADATAVAMENVSMRAERERVIRERTAELETANRDLKVFTAAVSHDLRTPLRAIAGFSEILQEDHGAALGPEGCAYLERIGAATRQVTSLLDGITRLTRLSREPLRWQTVDFSALAEELARELLAAHPGRQVAIDIEPRLRAHADPAMARVLMQNLISNAFKFTARCEAARITVGHRRDATPAPFFVQDNGIGFGVAGAGQLFEPFQRLPGAQPFPGHGIGLATVKRVVGRHRGDLWCEAEEGLGATFLFTLGAPSGAAAGAAP